MRERLLLPFSWLPSSPPFIGLLWRCCFAEYTVQVSHAEFNELCTDCRHSTPFSLFRSVCSASCTVVPLRPRALPVIGSCICRSSSHPFGSVLAGWLFHPALLQFFRSMEANKFAILVAGVGARRERSVSSRSLLEFKGGHRFDICRRNG